MDSPIALFRRRLLQRPKQISAIGPSSRFLGREMVRDMTPATGRVVEFGPGTGVFTEAILGKGIKPENLTLFELDEVFVPYLRERFPGVQVVQAGAETAKDVVEPGVGMVISGLPLLSFPRELQKAVLKTAFELLAPGGTYVQFTYGPVPPVPAKLIQDLGLTVSRGRQVWMNIPPARVFRFRRA